MLKVAIQGIRGSFHDQAAHDFYGQDIELLECDTFREVFEAVESGKADRGVVAIENSLQGSINAVYRLLARGTVWVEHEEYMRIEQFLIAAQPLDVTTLNTPSTRIASHPVALVQVEQWLNTHLPQAVRSEMCDTAEAVRRITESGSTHDLAVAGRAAAELYDGCIIAGPINDDVHNYTRFFGIIKSDTATPDPNATRTSITLETGHAPGSLYTALGVFADAGVNLSKLDSHPIAGDTYHYAFYVDFDLGYTDEKTTKLLTELTRLGNTIHVLGSYTGRSLPQ